LRAYLDAALDCVIIADASGRVVEFNPAAERTFGYTREETLGRTLAELIVPPSLRELHSKAFARFVKTREKRLFGRRLELTGMRADGTEFPIELALSCMESDPLLVCGALRDVTEVRRAERDLRTLADEQEALRRVATLVANEAAPDVIFASVAEEIARILTADRCAIGRFEADDSMTVIAYWSEEESKVPVGTRIDLQGDGVTAAVRKSRRPILIDDHEAFSGPLIDYARTLGSLPRSTVAAPIFVEGRVWGSIFASTMAAEIARGSETRVLDFAELVTTTLINAETRDSLRRLADEQAALRRVATLAARESSPVEVFQAVAKEAARVLAVDAIGMLRFEPDETATLVAQSETPWDPPPLGTTFTLEGENIVASVHRTGQAARMDDWENATGSVAAMANVLGVQSAVASPIVVDGRLWGALVAATNQSQPLPGDTESRIVEFTELLATAISNAESREALIVSRARIVAAGDEARRRIERNLHDGTQQRLVALGLDLQTVRDSIPANQQDAQSGLERIRHELEAVLEDVRELSQGLHPALLSQAGLGPSLRALARKSPIPVKLNVSVDERPSESTETAVYYVISEALANVVKHARASEISVALSTSVKGIQATIEDDGVGGAEASAGTGLVGLIDRVEALGGRFALDSPPGRGTTISIEMPLTAAPIDVVARMPGGRRSTPDDGPPPPPGLSEPIDPATLHAAVAASADAVYIVDPRGRIRFLNRAALRILGYEDERQLLGRTSHDTIHYLRPDGTPFPAEECPLLRPRLTGETVRVDDDWFVRQDGSLVAVAYSSAPVSLEDGRGAVVSFREVSEQASL
jgi:PAS domain S-box-containing protein